MTEEAAQSDICTGCGLAIPGGDEACNARFQDLGARGFGDARFGRVHRKVVDTYTLQHPDRYCVSAKSLAAHLCGLCELIERGGNPALPNMDLQRWLNGAVDIAKPALPQRRGAITIADVDGIDDPAAYVAAVDEWAAETWSAYAPLHALARDWLDRALAGGPARRHGHA